MRRTLRGGMCILYHRLSLVVMACQFPWSVMDRQGFVRIFQHLDLDVVVAVSTCGDLECQALVLYAVVLSDRSFPVLAQDVVKYCKVRQGTKAQPCARGGRMNSALKWGR